MEFACTWPRLHGWKQTTQPKVPRRVFEGMSEGLALGLVTAPDGQPDLLQMSYFNRTARACAHVRRPCPDDLEDVIGGKVCALTSRIEPRDYIDTAAALGRYTSADAD